VYAALENEVIPEFYERNEKGLPLKWLARVRESMARLTSEFSATRAIRGYTENHYLKAATSYSERAAGDSALGVALLHWQREIDQHWSTVRFGPLEIKTHDGQHFFQIEVSLGALTKDQLQIELYADSVHEGKPALEVMTAPEPHADSTGVFIYTVQVPATRPASDYTVRIIPYHPNASVPLEAGQILWQR
jgi:starch phosphorylase